MNYQKARNAFSTQKYDANRRGIAFLLTFEEWVKWWEDQLGPDWQSKRGHLKGQFVMSRPGDIGPYALWNIKCVQCGENVSEAHKGKEFSELHKQRIASGRRGKKHTDAAKMKLRIARLGSKRTEEAKEKTSQKVRGELNPSAKITEDKAKQIKQLIKIGLKNIEIKNILRSEGIKLSHSQICSIRYSRSWAHV